VLAAIWVAPVLLVLAASAAASVITHVIYEVLNTHGHKRQKNALLRVVQPEWLHRR
jgi:predicted PurR-regulated permease PerM